MALVAVYTSCRWRRKTHILLHRPTCKLASQLCNHDRCACAAEKEQKETSSRQHTFTYSIQHNTTLIDLQVLVSCAITGAMQRTNEHKRSEETSSRHQHVHALWASYVIISSSGVK